MSKLIMIFEVTLINKLSIAIMSVGAICLPKFFISVQIKVLHLTHVICLPYCIKLFTISQLGEGASDIKFFAGWPVTEEQLQEAATHAGVLDIDDDFLVADFRAECERLMPHIEEIEPEDCSDAFCYLKQHFSLPFSE